MNEESSKRCYSVAAYVKLAKLWEKNKEQAMEYHKTYYAEKYLNAENYKLYDVYVDITGQKQIYKRPQMLRLLNDCAEGKVNCIASQTKAYLAANGREFCYFLKLAWELNPELEVVTEDDNYHMDTIENREHQKQALKKMSDDFIRLDIKSYEDWKKKVLDGMETGKGR